MKTREFVLSATLAFFASAILASSSYAASSISLVWSHTGTPDANICGESCGPGPGIHPPATIAVSSTITANVVLQGDAVGVHGVFVSFLYDVTELVLLSVTEHPDVFVSPGNSFGVVSPGVMVDTTNGVIEHFDSYAGTDTGCLQCTVTLGTIRFHVIGGEHYEPWDVIPAILDNSFDVIVAPGGANISSTTVFNGAQVGALPLPEPTTGLLVALGLAGLVRAGRR